MYTILLSIFIALCTFCHAEEFCLLDDQAEMESYIAAFPFDQYTICDIPGQGMFYLDNIDDAIKNVLRAGLVWDPMILSHVSKYSKPGTTILDIGAHIGTETIVMSQRAGPKGRVHAFEPQKKIFRELTQNCKLNKATDNVSLYRYAIGDNHCIIEMSCAAPLNEGGTGIGGGGDLAEMRTIDSFGFTNVSFIKIDVEGGENAVIDGMVNTLANNQPVIVFEIMGGTPWEEASPEVQTMITHTKNKMEALGYKVKRISACDYLAIPIKEKAKKTKPLR